MEEAFRKMMKKRIFIQFFLCVSVVFVLVYISRFVISFQTQKNINSHNLGTIYFDPIVGKDISHSFSIVNDFSNQPVKLELAGRTCSCVSVNVSHTYLSYGETAQVIVSFRTDTASRQRKEIVFIKTSSDRLPLIQLVANVQTIPFLSIDVPNKFIPKLRINEIVSLPIKCEAYVDDEKSIDDIHLTCEGKGIHLKDVNRSVSYTDIDKKLSKVSFSATVIFQHEELKNYWRKQDGVIVLSRGDSKIESEISWIPIVPFNILPETIFMSRHDTKEVIISFDSVVEILNVTSENNIIMPTLMSPRQGKTHTISVKCNTENRKENSAIVSEIHIHTDMNHFTNIKIPVYLLN